MVSYEGEWVKSPESGTYRFDGSKAKGLLVPKTITYRELSDRIYRLLSIDRFEFGICMKFMYVSTVPVAPAEIVNDDDVKFFIGENCSEANLRTPLCVTLERRTLLVEQVDYEDGSSQTFNGTEENELGFCFNNEREDDDVGTSSGLLALEDSPNEPQVGTGHPQSTDNATLVDPVTPVCPFTPAAPVAAVAPTAPRSSQPGDSHKPVEWVTTKEDLIASFNIHKKQAVSSNIQQKETASSNIQQKQTVSSNIQQKQTSSLNIQKKQTASSNKQQKNTESLPSSSANHSDGLEVKQVFSSKKELRKKLNLLAVRENFEFKVYKSDKDRLLLTCVDNNCKWRLRASRCENSTSFVIRNFVKDHTCLRQSSARHHRQANKLRIESLIRSKCQAMNGKYSPINIIKDVQIEFGVKLTYPQAWRARDSVVNSDSGPDEQCQSELSSERPKKRREPPAEEDRPTQRKCGNCGIIGHNRLTCQMYIEQQPSTSSGGAEECT